MTPISGRSRALGLPALLALCLFLLLTITTQAAFAGVPGVVPSQVSLAIGGGASHGRSAMAFSWVTDASVPLTGQQVVYSTSPTMKHSATVAATGSAPAATDILPAGRESYFKPVHAFKAVLRGLAPGETYYYKLGSAASGFTAVESFDAAANPASDAPFSFVVSADTQGKSPSEFQNTADLYSYIKSHERGAEFLVHTGDLVEDGYKSDEWQCFFDAAQPLLSGLPIMATPGNHDGGGSRDANNVQYTSRLNYSSLTQPAGLSPAALGTVYSFEYGDALFVCLNTNLGGTDNTIQWDFLKAQAAASDKAWKIAFMHIAPYDPGSSHYSVDNTIGYKLTQAGIDLVLDGHEHAYARTTLVTTDSSGSSATGITQVPARSGRGTTYVTGGSVYNYAYGLNATKDTSWNDFFYDLRVSGNKINAPGVYATVDVNARSISYKAHYRKTAGDEELSVIDSFEIHHPRRANQVVRPIGGGTVPASVTFLFDPSTQRRQHTAARFNWTGPITTTATQLLYAKRSDFLRNGGTYTDKVMGASGVIDLAAQLTALSYTGGTASYTGTGEYCYAPIMSHKAVTTALEPGTTYVYCVGDGAKNVTSVTAPASFTTPDANTRSFNFLYFTDAQQGASGSYANTLTDYGEFVTTLTQGVSDFPDADFIMSGGDQVNYAFDTWEWDAFFAANASIFAKYPFYMTTGNHECDGAGNAWVPGSVWTPVDQSNSEVLGHFNPPQNGAAFYGAGDGTQPMTSGVDALEAKAGNYYFIHGNTLFLVLDYQDSTLGTLTATEQAWVKSVVKQNPTKWRVAVLHKSMFGYRNTNPTTSTARKWTDTFDAAGIDLVLMGHDHLYTRTKYYSNGGATTTQAPGSGTTYITGASSNTDNRSSRYTPNAYTLVNSTGDYGRAYVDIAISGAGIRVTTRGLLNSVLTTVENGALVTDTPRTPDLGSFSYPVAVK